MRDVLSKKILLVSYGGGHVDMLLPIYKLLEKQGFNNISFLALTAAQMVLKKNGIPYLGYKDFIKPEEKQALYWGRRLLETIPDRSIVDEEESIAYLGLSYMDLENRLGVKEAAKFFAEKDRHAFLQLGPSRRILDTLKPNLLVTTSSPKTEKAMLLNAKELKIPSICLIDLYDPNTVKDRAHMAGYGDIICVESEFTKQKLIESGRPSKEIKVVGSPHYDKFFTKRSKEEIEAYKKEKNIKGNKNILWVRMGGSQATSYCKEVEQELIRIAKKNQDFNIIFKPHPNDTVSYENLPSNIKVSDRDEDVQTVTQSCSIVIIVNSTLGLQAAIMGKKVLQFLDSPFYHTTPYADTGLTHGIENLSCLEREIKRQFFETKEAHIKIPKNSTEKIVKICEEMLKIRCNVQ